MPYLPDDLENKTEKPADPVELAPPRESLSDPAGYKPDAGLVDAMKVALLLRKPLLVTGRPGTGKTELGHYLGWKMQLPACQFNAKSSSTARDPFYTYDAIGHYRAGGGVLPFLTFNALGTAILECAVATDELRMLVPGLIPAKPRQSVVVIDEIDKAPRDFPNDLLNEIDKKYFHIPELKNVRIEASKAESPILIITSNSEKNLPGAFLRRCIYYDIPFPKPDELRLIVSRRIEEFADANGPLLTSAVNRFSSLAEDSAGMKHPPGTAELLDWMLALVRRGAKPDQDLSQQEQLVEQTFTALVKSQDDAGTAQQLLGLSSRAGN